MVKFTHPPDVSSTSYLAGVWTGNWGWGNATCKVTFVGGTCKRSLLILWVGASLTMRHS